MYETLKIKTSGYREESLTKADLTDGCLKSLFTEQGMAQWLLYIVAALRIVVIRFLNGTLPQYGALC